MIYFSVIKQNFINLDSISFDSFKKDIELNNKLQEVTDSGYVPSKLELDQVSANNVLTFTDNKVCGPPENQDCNENPGYIESMCYNRRIKNKDMLCNSIVGVTPRPQDSYNPVKFENF
jgi:hypothetical protein